MSTTESPERRSWRLAPATLLLTLGLLFLALSFIWPGISSGRSAWPDEKAQAYQAASAEVHRLSMLMLGTAPEQQTRARHEELAEAQTKYAALRADLEKARSQPARFATILRYSGILMAACGTVWLLVRRERSPAEA